MRTQSRDTDSKIEAVLIAMLRKAKPHQKFAQVRSLSKLTLSLSRRGIARQNPQLKEAELHELFVRYQYGDALADRFGQYLRNRVNGSS